MAMLRSQAPGCQMLVRNIIRHHCSWKSLWCWKAVVITSMAVTEICVPVSENNDWPEGKQFSFHNSLQFSNFGEYFYICDIDLHTSVVLFLVITMLSSGAARPASGGNQSCPTGIVASLSAVAAAHGHCCSSHSLLWDYGSLIILKIWVLLPALQVVCFLLTGWWTKARQGWDRQLCWRTGLAYAVMKFCLGRTEASGICCLGDKIQKKVSGVMGGKEIFSWISGVTFLGGQSSFPRETQ